jgi:hypothetical protein
MSTALSLPAIPWSHQRGDFGSVWVWETSHFLVTVTGNDRSCYFTIADKSADPAGAPKPLADGQAATFEQTENQIRATLGKAYNPTLGYGHYAGPLATTFTLGSGTDVDLGRFVGQLVDVACINPDGTETMYRGTARVEHYELILDQGAVKLRILPSYIASITQVGTATMSRGPLAALRTMTGTVTVGCTGRPGYLIDTVEHSGPACPIHEDH